MNVPRFLKQVYASMPSLRPVLAGVYGYRLRYRRYGGTADTLAEEALQRDTWTPEQWSSWQQERLARMLWHAARNVPYYRSQWDERRRRGDRSDVELLANWPVLEKNAIRDHFTALQAEHMQLDDAEIETTSGTTGSPVRFLLSRAAVREWYALCEARFRRWNGVSRHDRWAMIGAQTVTPLSQTRPPFWVWNTALNQLYMSAYHLTPANIPSYLDAMRSFRVQYVWGHSSALDALAMAVQKRPDLKPDLRIILSSSEPLTPRQRLRIAAAFGCPVRETYGMSEMVAAASECDGGRLHLWPEAGVTEIVHGSVPVPAGVAGDLLATCLLNEAMPLVRYRVGDRMLLADSGQCSCGRYLPVIRAIEGRISDMLVTADGASISPSAMEAIFDFDAPMAESQIIQESIRQLRVRYVPLAERNEMFEKTLCDRIRERMGDVEIQVEVVPEIPRGPNGKFRAVICRLDRSQIAEAVASSQRDASCAHTA